MDEAKGKSWAALLLEVFTSPAKAFKEIAERPRFGAAGITLTIINLAFALLTLPKWREYSLMGVDFSEYATEQMSAEALEALTQTTASVSHILIAVLSPWVMSLIVALLLKIFAAVRAKEAPFGSLFAVGIYGYAPVVLGAVITSILIMFTAVENIDKVNLTLAVFAPTESGFLYSFLTACSPFTWWSLILYGIGAAAVMKDKQPNGAIIFLFVLWLMYALIIGALGNWAAGLY